jgi:hypothetical protein
VSKPQRDAERERAREENDMIKIIVKDVLCPKCGAGELNPKTAHLPPLDREVLIRAFKAQDDSGHWWSQCLVCAGFFDKDGNELQGGDKEKGWF